MKFKNILIVFSIFFMIVCIGSVAAAENASELSSDDGDIALESEGIDEIAKQNNAIVGESNSSEVSDDTSVQTNSTPTKQETKKTTAYALGTTEFIKKSNKYMKVKVFTINKKGNLVFHKNVKLIVKVKIGKQTKTYNVKTNSKGEAKVFNVKNLKVGTYKISVTSNDDRYSINDGGPINIYNKKQKSLTLKVNKWKKIKGDRIYADYIKKNGQYKKGVYATSYNAKDPLNKIPHTLVMKAKFFFKNKKTGKVISKTVKTKDDSKYLSKILPYHKLIKGYKPIKVKIWYVTV